MNVIPHTLFSEYDIQLFKKGIHHKLYNFFGCKQTVRDKAKGCYFAVWAPNAFQVTVFGTFNNWNSYSHILNKRWDESGIWEGFIKDVNENDTYKFVISAPNGVFEKSDPFAYYCETPPDTANLVYDISKYTWTDKIWLDKRKKFQQESNPISIYEVHLGSWFKPENKESSFLPYSVLKEKLVQYVKYMGFTHVELLPIMEHPYYPSWGYQIVNFYAPTSRFGNPLEFMDLINTFHEENIGVILDWVPSHFPTDGHGLGYFDGSHLYEHPNPQKGYHPDWQSLIFNYERPEVRSFLLSNMLFWAEKYHIDGFRVDAVASVIHLDFSRNEGQWSPNVYGTNVYLDAVDFVKNLNNTMKAFYPDVIIIAEESTSYPKVTGKTYNNGLGFDQKWMMGWMHDTLKYFALDPIYRQYHHNQITFSLLYAFSEKFCLALSHDEVVHGKSSLLYKMHGDEWQKFAHLRLLFGYMYTHPGSKLLFMGNEFGQTSEWSHMRGLDWHLLKYDLHIQLQNYVRSLNQFYKKLPALHEYNFDSRGFKWISADDSLNSVLVYQRIGKNEKDIIYIALNFTPVIRYNYEFGVQHLGNYEEIYNSDSKEWGGGDVKNHEELIASDFEKHDQKHILSVTLPPLALVIFRIK